MKTSMSNSTNSEQYRITDYFPGGETCDICKRDISELDPFIKTFAEVHENLRNHFGEEAFSKIFPVNNREVHKLMKTWRTHGTDNVGSSWECTDCIKLPDQVATVQSVEAHLREQVKKVCEDVGCDYLSPVVIDQHYSPQEYEICRKRQKSMKRNYSGRNGKFSYLVWAITKNMIAKQKYGSETVFIINGPPVDTRCTICGKKADELEPFDQALVEVCKTNGKKIGGDVAFTHCVCPYITEANTLAKNFRNIDENGTHTTWECTECFVLPGKEAVDRLKSMAKQ